MKIDDLQRGAFYASDVSENNVETAVFRVTSEDATDPKTNRRVPVCKTYQGKEFLLTQRHIRKAAEDEWKTFLSAVRLVKDNRQSEAATLMRGLVESR